MRGDELSLPVPFGESTNPLSLSLPLYNNRCIPRGPFSDALSQVTVRLFTKRFTNCFRYLLVSSIISFSLSLSGVPATRSSSPCLTHTKPSTVRAVSPYARELSAPFIVLTTGNVHFYHATALAPPPGTEGEINERKVRREFS